MCAECRVATPVGFKCGTCVGNRDGRGDSSGRAERERVKQRDRGGPGRPPNRRRIIVGVGVVAVLAVVGGLIATSGGGSGTTQEFAKSSGPVQPTASNTDLAVQFQGAGRLSIGAELLLPPGSNARTPGVVIVPDDGATNRDGTAPANAIPDRLYSDLAQTLAGAGIASLRYDRRGEGQSVMPPGKAITFPDVVGDAKAGIAFLAGRADVNRSRIAVVGDGQGGLVALSAAAANPTVKAVVLVSTPGQGVAANLAEQLRAVATTPAMGAQLVAQLRSVVASLQAGKPEPASAQLPAAIQPLLPPNEGPYLRSIFGLVPATLAATVQVPVLVVQGGAAAGMSPADSQDLVAALGAKGQALTPAADDRNLEMSAVPAPATGVTTGMQATHSGVGTSLQRDDATLSAVAHWLTANTG